VHELRIGDVVELAGSRDTADPELTELLLSFLTAVESMLFGLDVGFFGSLEELMSGSVVAFDSL
jgi:hypothetical protein